VRREFSSVEFRTCTCNAHMVSWRAKSEGQAVALGGGGDGKVQEE